MNKVRVNTTVSLELIQQAQNWNNNNPYHKIRRSDALSRGLRSMLDEKRMDGETLSEFWLNQAYIPIQVKERMRKMQKTIDLLNSLLKEKEAARNA